MAVTKVLIGTEDIQYGSGTFTRTNSTGGTTTATKVPSGVEVFNVKDYGAKGDGVTDDTVAIQAAIDAANTAGGGTVFLDQSTYAVASEILIPHLVSLIGSGTTIKLTTVTARLRWQKTAGGNTINHRGLTQGVLIDGNSIATIGVQVGVVVNRRWADIRVQDCTDYCWQLDGCQNSVFENCVGRAENGSGKAPWRIINGSAGNSFVDCHANYGTMAHIILGEIDATTPDYDASLATRGALNNTFIGGIMEIGSPTYNLKITSAVRNTFVGTEMLLGSSSTAAMFLDTAADINTFYSIFANFNNTTVTSGIIVKGTGNAFYEPRLAQWTNVTSIFQYFDNLKVVGWQRAEADRGYMPLKMFDNQSGVTPGERLLFVPNEAGFTTADIPAWTADTHVTYWDATAKKQKVWDGTTTTIVNPIQIIEQTFTWDPPSILDGDAATTFVTVTGASLGDFVVVSAPYNLSGVLLQGHVASTDNVTVRIQNESGGTIDLVSGTWTLRVLQF